MSRRITIKSSVEIAEVDLAEETVAEMRRQGAQALRYDAGRRVFLNDEYDDQPEDTVARAVALYHKKLQKRREAQVVERLEAGGYTPEIAREGGKIRIVARKRVYG